MKSLFSHLQSSKNLYAARKEMLGNQLGFNRTFWENKPAEVVLFEHENPFKNESSYIESVYFSLCILN